MKEFVTRARKIMDEEVDSVIIFSSRDERWLDKQIVGRERTTLDHIL